MLRHSSRSDRWTEEVKSASPLARVAMLVVAVAGLAALAYIARRHLWKAVAVVADAVEEVADTVEDAAEDVRDAARARAE
jgi:divalent metal cation (Fe/Co/Zn/Cd) transporter